MITTKHDWIYQLHIKEQLQKNKTMDYKIGSRGADIRQIQTRLGALVTGVYDTDTYRKVHAFQQQAGINANGVVCDQTWAALFPAPVQPIEELPIQETEEPTEESTTQVTTNKKK